MHLDWAGARGSEPEKNPRPLARTPRQAVPPRSKGRKVQHHAACLTRIASFMQDLRAREGVDASAKPHEFQIPKRAAQVMRLERRWGEFEARKGGVDDRREGT